MNEPATLHLPATVERRDRPAPPAPAPVLDNPTPMQMLQAAIQRGVDTEQLKQLMDLNERYEANQARKAFVAAMAQFKREPPVIFKDKHVKFKMNDGSGFVEYDHATLGAVTTAIIEGLAKVGVSHRWQVEQPGNGMVRITCIITHELGHSEQTAMECGIDNSGKKNPIQQIGSAKTYLERYTLLAITGLATNDDDDGKGTDGEKEYVRITEKQVADLQALISEWKIDKPAMLTYYRIAALEDIAAENYARICAEVVHKGKIKASAPASQSNTNQGKRK